MPKTKKPKLLPVKEVRALLEKREKQLAAASLRIVDLQNQVESLEGARRNLRMMYETHEAEKDAAIHGMISARASVKQLDRDVQRITDYALDFQNKLKVYETASAFQLWKLSVSRALAPIKKSVSSFFERLTFRFRK